MPATNPPPSPLPSPDVPSCPQWEFIGPSRPALRPGVRAQRRHFRSRRCHVLHDPASNQFFRLDPVSYHLVALLDGGRTVEQAAQLTQDRFGSAAPRQHEIAGLLRQLQHVNLLALPGADGDLLVRRMRRRKLRRRARQAGQLLFVRIPLFDPAPALDWLLPLVRPLLSVWTLVVWAALLVWAVAQVAVHGDAFVHEASGILRPSNLPWLLLVYILVKIVHEFAHGLVCRHFGGQVHEMGIMLLVFAPVPYCDATSSWQFSNRLSRAAVGLAGIVIELAVAAAAALLWVNTSAGTAHEVAFNTMFIAGLAALLTNANPLLRFDGYYVLSDVLDIPNLYLRANRHALGFIRRVALGLKSDRAAAAGVAEGGWLSLYFVASWSYRVVVISGIIWFVSRQLFGLGILLAAVAIFSWIVRPLLRYVRWLLTDGALRGKRVRALAVNGVILAAALLMIGVVPLRRQTRAEAVIEDVDWVQLVAGTDGFVSEVHAADGDDVELGQILLRAANEQLIASKARAEAELDDVTVRLAEAIESRPAVVRVLESEARWHRSRLEQMDRRLQGLEVRSPMTGRLVAPQLSRIRGRFLRRGDVLGQVRSGAALRATAVLDQTQSAWLAEPEAVTQVELRTAGRPARRLRGRIQWIGPAAETTLPHALLGVVGGGRVMTDLADGSGRAAVESFFVVHVNVEDESDLHVGQRAVVRIIGRRRPLARQWWRKLLQQL